MSICTCGNCPVKESVPFNTLNDNELSTLATSKSKFVIKDGDPLFFEGEHMSGIYCIKEGIAKLTKKDISGQQQIIKIIAPGTLLGQEAMLTHEPANLSAIAAEDMEVCFIPKAKMIGFITGNPKFSISIINTIAQSADNSFENIIARANKTDRQRIAETLLYLHDSFERNVDGSVRIRLSRTELAGMMGIETAVCKRILLDLNRLGCIEVATRKITIIDREKLALYK